MLPLHIHLISIADLPEGGGRTTRLKTLVQTLRDAGHDVHIWIEHGLGSVPTTLQHPRGMLHGASYEYVLGHTRRGHGFGSIATKLRAIRVLARRLQTAAAARKVDLLWFNQLYHYDIAPLTRLARRFRLRTIQSYEDERLELVSDAPRSLAQRVMALDARLADRRCPRWADAIVVISEYLREKYARLCGDPCKVWLVPTIVDCAAWDCGPEPETDCPVLLYSGMFAEQDEMDRLLDAIARLRAEGAAFRLVMLGDNQREPARRENVRRRVAELDLGECVELRGFVPLEAVRAEAARSHILLNLRRESVWSHSGLSTKLSEYLASGRCVITTAVGDVPRYLRDGDNAVVLPPAFAAEQLAAALKRLLNSPEKRRAIGQAGRQVALRHFDVPVAARTLDGMLERVFGS